MNPAALLLAQARETLDAADRLGHATPTVILAAATLGLIVVVGLLAREVVRLQNGRHDDAEKHAAEKLALSEKHAADLLAQVVPRLDGLKDAAIALSGVAEALTDARDTYERATPLSTPAPAPRRSRT